MTTIWEPICSKCGSSLAADVSFCPQCGTPTSSYYSNSGVSPSDPTAASFHSSAPQHKPATDYGSPPYGVPLQNPYEPLNPYEAPPPPPAPKRQRKSSILIGILSGIIVTVLILGSVGAFVLLTKGAKNTPSGNTSLPTVTTAPANPNINPYGGGGTLVLNDPLRDNSLGYGWSEGTSQYGTCAFTGGAYHVSTNSGIYCGASPDFSNFAFEVQMTIIKGDTGGIHFRSDRANDRAYGFYVFQDGTYNLIATQGTAPTQILVQTTSSSAIHQGLDQTNIIAVVAKDSTITLYVNHQLLASVTDSTYSHGRIALGAAEYSTGGQPTEVVYNNAKVWTF